MKVVILQGNGDSIRIQLCPELMTEQDIREALATEVVLLGPIILDQEISIMADSLLTNAGSSQDDKATMLESVIRTGFRYGKNGKLSKDRLSEHMKIRLKGKLAYKVLVALISIGFQAGTKVRRRMLVLSRN